MGAMEYNESPLVLTEGKAFIDGIEVLDLVDFEITFTPDVWTGKHVGERSPSSRWTGYSIKGKMTRRRATNWMEKMIKKYKKNGKTPELTVQGYLNDKNSDYYQKYKKILVTAVGCVPTGDLNLIKLGSDTNAVLEDVINFNVKDVV